MTEIIRVVRRRSDPGDALRSAMKRSPHLGEPTTIIAVGKAASSMLEATRGLIGYPNEFVSVQPAGSEGVGRYVVDHPIPTLRNLEAASRVLYLASWYGPGSVGVHGVCTVLLSGGASACLSLPVAEVSLNDLAAITRALLRAGAAIEELNTVRRHVEVLKGGGLAAALAPMPVDVYVLSDVIGDALHSIGSGPCAPDPTTFADAVDVLDRYELWHEAPSVSAYLEAGARGERPETRKPGDSVFNSVRTEIIASNATAATATADCLRDTGFMVVESKTGVIGEATNAGRRLGRRAAELASEGDAPRAIVWGGETTVTVGTAGGKGGRNQEFALAAAVELAGSRTAADRVVILTFATDGVDGPTDAAGAVVTGRKVLDAPGGVAGARDALARHDSHTYLDRLGCLIRTGPTGTNVCDVAVALVY